MCIVLHMHGHSILGDCRLLKVTRRSETRVRSGSIWVDVPELEAYAPLKFNKGMYSHASYSQHLPDLPHDLRSTARDSSWFAMVKGCFMGWFLFCVEVQQRGWFPDSWFCSMPQPPIWRKQILCKLHYVELAIVVHFLLKVLAFLFFQRVLLPKYKLETSLTHKSLLTQKCV